MSTPPGRRSGPSRPRSAYTTRSSAGRPSAYRLRDSLRRRVHPGRRIAVGLGGPAWHIHYRFGFNTSMCWLYAVYTIRHRAAPRPPRTRIYNRSAGSRALSAGCPITTPPRVYTARRDNAETQMRDAITTRVYGIYSSRVRRSGDPSFEQVSDRVILAAPARGGSETHDGHAADRPPPRSTTRVSQRSAVALSNDSVSNSITRYIHHSIVYTIH